LPALRPARRPRLPGRPLPLHAPDLGLRGIRRRLGDARRRDGGGEPALRILHLVDEPYDSGIVHYALSAARGLKARGHQVGVWARAGAVPLAKAREAGLDVLPFARPWLDLARLRRHLREKGVELAVAHTGAAHSVAVAAAAGTSARVLRTRADARPMRRRPGSRLLWSRTCGFVAANARILEESRAFAPRPGFPAALIYEGLDARAEPRPPVAGSPLVGLVGRLDPVKGHARFLEAAAAVLAEVPDARFVAIGREENVSIADLRRRARELGLAERVEFTGHVSDVARAMARCHVGVVASLGSEAVSRAALEWLAAGRPLVATAVGCLPEYLEGSEAGLVVPPDDARALGEAILRLARDPMLRERMGRAARRRYEERFTLERFLGETERFYEQALHPVPS
jgi:glycosyltransferase involved in cell wall biosynthesis